MTKVAALRLSADEVPGLADRVAAALAAPPALLVVLASPKIDLDTILPALAARFPEAALLASSTSGEFTQDGDGSGTVSVFALAGDYKIFTGLGTGLRADPEAAVQAAIAGHPSKLEGYPHRTGIVLLDPLAGHGEEAALLLATYLGESPLVGGAAGDDLAMTKTVVAAGTQKASDAIVFATLFSRKPLGIGVKHGHSALTEQRFRVTKAEGSVVLEVDGRPAWDVWTEASAKRAREVGLDPEGQPGAYLLRYEAGLKVGPEFKVRAPLAPQPGGGILFATAMPEGTVFQIMEADVSGQIESAVTAAHLARSALGGATPAGALVFDCICRKLVLGDDYARMLKAVSDELGSAPLAGFETYGEIAMNSGDMSGFHNTTSVVLAFPHDDG